MPKISVVILTLNEEENIRACIESVSWADEIIIVDSFSTDNTLTICREYKAIIIQKEWPGHVKQKQFGIEQAAGEWVLSLDADERLSPEAVEELHNKILSSSSAVQGFILPRQSYYLGKWIRHGGWYPDYKLRLFRKGTAKQCGHEPHDKFVVNGLTKKFDGNILHYPYRDISDQLKTVDTFSCSVASLWHREGKAFSLFLLLLLLLFRPKIRFLEMYIWKLGFLDGMPGFIIAVVSSYYIFLKYAKLWELQRGVSDRKG